MSSSKSVDWKQIAGLVAAVGVVVWLWNTPVIYPLKVLVVFFHEMSHGLVAVATGGRIERIEVVAQEGGLCLTQGGNRFLTLSAGYLGSLIWGGILLITAARTKQDKMVSFVLGLLLAGVAVAVVRPLYGFGFWFGALSGAALVASGIWLPMAVNDWLLRLIGLTSCLYAVMDIKSDILDRPQERSDAYMLSREFGMPVMFWGVVWITIAAVAAGWFLWMAARTRSEQTS